MIILLTKFFSNAISGKEFPGAGSYVANRNLYLFKKRFEFGNWRGKIIKTVYFNPR